MRTPPSAGRTFAGIVIAILTVALTVIMLPFALCFGVIAASQHQYAGVLVILLVQFGVPVLGLVACVRLLRGGPQLAPAASAGSPFLQSPPVSSPPIPAFRAKSFTVNPAEFQQFRGALMAYLLISALLWFATNFVVYGRYVRPSPLGSLVFWVLGELPYLIALVTNWNRANRIGIALATCYPVIGLASTVLALIPMLSMSLRFQYFSRPLLLLVLLLGMAIQFLLLLFAWRATKHTGESDEITLYASVLVGSVVYMFFLRMFGPFLLYHLR